MKFVLIGIGIAVLIAATGFQQLSSPRKLDLVDAAWPGGGDIRQVAEGVAFGAHTRQRLDVWRPADEMPHPVLIFFYGGSWNSGDRANYRFVARAFTEKGFVVVIPDYRLVPDVRFPAFVEDSAAAVRWTVDNIARFGGDPDRIVLAGHSAGAYNAIMLGLDARWLTAAGVDPGAVKGIAALAGAYDFYPFTTDSSKAAFGAVADPRTTQPIAFVRHDAPPLWLATGDADTLVKPRNSRALTAAMRAAGASATLREYPGLGHYDIAMALSRPFRGKAPVLDEASAFLLASANASR